MNVLPEDTIKEKILPHLLTTNKGPEISISKLVSIIQLILYRLKTGCQWRMLPMLNFMSEQYSWKSVYHHFNKWSKQGAWLDAWADLVRDNIEVLDLSSAELDGSHTPVKRGGESVGYQGRKSANTSNSLYMSDRQGIILACSMPESGNHHDAFDARKHFSELVAMLKKAGISTDGLFVNADAGFDTKEFRSLCYEHRMIPNFCYNKRNGSILDREEFFDPLLYEDRNVIEHAFAWLDAYKALLNRYETSARNWLSMNVLGFMTRFISKLT